MLRLVRYLWTLPNTLLGLSLVLVALRRGCEARLIGGVLEIHGPGIRRLLERLTGRRLRAAAITVGHVVLGRDAAELDRTRAHERVHVAQYERWGPAFLPAYLLSSLAVALRGGDGYRENRFERRAYAAE